MVYLDYNATTPLDPAVAEGLALWQAQAWANPSSTHRSGQRALRLVEDARRQVGDLVARRARDVIFTSGASEAANLALLGLGLSARTGEQRDFLLGATEHKAVKAAVELAAHLSGGRVRDIQVTPSGELDIDDFIAALGDTKPVALAAMHANNETGVVHPLTAIRELLPREVLLLVDMTQSAGKVSLADIEFDIAFLSAHKIYGPKGVGALVADRHVQGRLTSAFPGGGQEQGLRGGTIPAPLVAAFGLAADISARRQERDAEHARSLLARLTDGLRGSGVAFDVNGADAPRIPNTLNMRIPGADAEAVMANAPLVEISDGSACTSAQPGPSHVLTAMGLTRGEASESLRISVGRPTTNHEVDSAVSDLVASIRTVRQLQEGIPA